MTAPFEDIIEFDKPTPPLTSLPSGIPVGEEVPHVGFMGSSFENGPVVIDVEPNQLIPVALSEALEALQALGFFIDKKNFALLKFDRYTSKIPIHRFKILQKEPLVKTRRAVLHGNANTLQQRYSFKLVKKELDGSRRRIISLGLLEGYAEDRFKYYPQDLIKNWAAVYYLDFYTGYLITWSEQLLKKVDKYIIAEDTRLNLLGDLLLANTPLTELDTYMELPENWSQHMFETLENINTGKQKRKH